MRLDLLLLQTNLEGVELQRLLLTLKLLRFLLSLERLCWLCGGGGEQAGDPETPRVGVEVGLMWTGAH
jgi:hypothetical protein